jgi:hypothetical protein
MANIFLAAFVLLTLLLFAPLFQWLPEAVLAAVVINAMWGSASPKKVMKLRHDDLVDFVLGIVTGIAGARHRSPSGDGPWDHPLDHLLDLPGELPQPGRAGAG